MFLVEQKKKDKKMDKNEIEKITKLFFEKYEEFVGMLEKTFQKIKIEYPDRVVCKEGCSDCCHALFDLTLIEAMYINYHFNKKFTGNAKELMIKKASSIDRKIYKMKKDAYNASKKGIKDIEILGELSMKKARCPFLNEKDLCDLYEHRPLTCRIYGIPTSNMGVSHTCGLSGFEKGGKYPTINMDIVYAQLYDMSRKFTEKIKTKYSKLFEILVPLSMALLTNYNDDYLGLIKIEKEKKIKKVEKK